jgi:threonine/homoserine/homoserine lactone efflux protein
MALIPGAQDLPLFIATGLLLNLTPGPDSLLIVTRAAQHGWRAGVAASTGVSLGICLHVAAGAFGLAALLARLAPRLRPLHPRGGGLPGGAGAAPRAPRGRAGGAAACACRGTGRGRGQRGCRHRCRCRRPCRRHRARFASTPPTLGRLLAQGFLTNALNPKIRRLLPRLRAALHRRGRAAQGAHLVVLLGAVFNLGAWLWGLVLALGAGAAGARLAPAPAAVRGLRTPHRARLRLPRAAPGPRTLMTLVSSSPTPTASPPAPTARSSSRCARADSR